MRKSKHLDHYTYWHLVVYANHIIEREEIKLSLEELRGKERRSKRMERSDKERSELSEGEERQRYQKVSTLYDLENLLYMLETKFSEYEEDSYYHQGYVCSRLALCREVIKDLRVNDSDAHMLDIWLQQDDENREQDK